MEDVFKIDENSTLEIRVIKSVVNSYGVKWLISDRVEAYCPISSDRITITLSGG